MGVSKQAAGNPGELRNWVLMSGWHHCIRTGNNFAVTVDYYFDMLHVNQALLVNQITRQHIHIFREY